ncbi:hypothetical protein ABZ646_40575, partial [Streptomyces sp. NPDC007162]
MTTPLASSAFDSLRLDAVRDQEALRRAYEAPSDAAVRKQMTELLEVPGADHGFAVPMGVPPRERS